MNDPFEEWVLRPVDEGMCKYESLLDGTLGLHDLARMNEYLDTKQENEARYHDAIESQNR